MRRGISLTLLSMLLLTGCSGENDEAAPEVPEHGGDLSAESSDAQGTEEIEGTGEADAPADGEVAGQDQVGGPERLITAATAGAQRAASFGFDELGFVSDDVAQSYRELLEENSLAGEDPEVDVSPASCAAPLAAVDFSPLLLGPDAVRADFFAQSFSGAGSIELATLDGSPDAQRVTAHRENVRELLDSCAETEFTLDGVAYELEITEPELDSAGDETVAYSWERSGEGTTFAQILFTQVEQDIIMVSFTGDEAVATAEFTSIAEAIAAEAAAALTETE